MSLVLQQSTVDGPTFSDGIGALQPLVRRSMFWRPVYLEPSAWLEHVPFAFWLVEAHRPRVLVELGTHYGVSYFSFCQAVERLALDTRCYAIDTWEGDQHAGFYGEDVYQLVRNHNDSHYSAFSRLVRSTFDEALDHFSDASVDLLHIDGMHSFEAVSHDFESWRRKLSDNAVVIFHDTNVRERGFGVSRLLEDLKRQYPTFEFVHGHGLAVVGVGSAQEDLLRRLFEAGEQPAACRAIRDVFATLGRGCADSFNVRRRDENAKKLAAELADTKRKLAEAQTDIDARFAELAALTRILEQKETEVEQERARSEALADKLRIIETNSGWRVVTALRRLTHSFGGWRQHRRLRQLVQSSGFFDADWYLARNVDVAQAGADPLDHFILFGGQEGRAPSPRFNSSDYLSANPDVRDAGLNPLVHYLIHGRAEGRICTPYS